MTYERRNDSEIAEIALGLYCGTIYTSQHCRDQDISLVFLAFTFMSPEMRHQQCKVDGIVVLFESMDKAAKLGINGRPIFFSHKGLDQEDWNRVITKLDQIKAAVGGVIPESHQPPDDRQQEEPSP